MTNERCSFCHTPQEAVTKLISTPTDFPRAYICDECVETCMAIVEEDRSQEAPRPHPMLLHPLAPELMDCVAEWMLKESLGTPAPDQINRLRDVAARMFAKE